MTSNAPRTAAPAGPDVPTIAEAAGDLATAVDGLQQVDRIMATAVLALSRTVGTGICETVEGLPADLLLANLCRLIQSDRSTVLTAADVLRHLPVTATLWAEGSLSWGQVRNIALKVSRLRAGQRGEIDRRIAASAADHDGVGVYGPDGLLDAVDRAVADLTELDELLRREETQPRNDFLWTQQGFDGSLKLYGELGPVRGAKVAEALQQASPPVETDTSRGLRMAQALETMADAFLTGGRDRPGRASINIIVDLSQATPNAAGTVDLHVPGCLPTLSAKLVEMLAADADLRATIFDGRRPLASSKRVNAADIPAATRRAVALRDRGDRMPGSRDPIVWCDLHHLHERGKGGTHDPDNIVALRSRWHQLLHRRGWWTTLDPATGRFTIERDGRRYHSLPHGTPLSPDPQPELDLKPDPPPSRGRHPGSDPPAGSTDPPADPDELFPGVPATSETVGFDPYGNPLPF